MPSPLPRKGLAHETSRALIRCGRPSLRGTAAVFTSLSALAATSLIAAPSAAVPLADACALKRTGAHHSEGVDTWNAAYPRPVRALDALLVFLSFPDATPLAKPAELAADHFPATSRFFERASYGRFTLRPHPRHEWIEMPRPSTAYAIQRDWGSTHRAAYLRDAMQVADDRIDFSAYDIMYFIADPDAPGVDSDATKVVNLETPLKADGKVIRRVVTVFENHPPDRLVLAHETGHVFDLPDLYHRPTDGRGDWDTHVGDWDLMGSQFGLAPDLLGWHKWKLGWLHPRQVMCVREPGTTRLTLEPLEAGPVTDGAVMAGAEHGTATMGARAAGEAPAGVGGRGADWDGPEGESGTGRSRARDAGAAAGSGGTNREGAGSGADGGGGDGGATAGGQLPPSRAPRAREQDAEAEVLGVGVEVQGRRAEGHGARGGSQGVGPEGRRAGGEVPGVGVDGQIFEAAGRAVFGSGRGAKLAVVRTGPDTALGLEAREPVGNDASACTEGILVYRIRSGAQSGGGPIEVVDAHPHTESCLGDSVYPPLADAPVGVGETFTVPGDNVRVEVEGRTPSGAWTVKITTLG